MLVGPLTTFISYDIYKKFPSSLQVIPPGMEFHHIVPLEGDMDVETEGSEDHPALSDPPIWFEVMFFYHASTLSYCGYGQLAV